MKCKVPSSHLHTFSNAFHLPSPSRGLRELVRLHGGRGLRALHHDLPHRYGVAKPSRLVFRPPSFPSDGPLQIHRYPIDPVPQRRENHAKCCAEDVLPNTTVGYTVSPTSDHALPAWVAEVGATLFAPGLRMTTLRPCAERF